MPDSLGAPLAGVKVLDLSHALAGAACAQILTRFGAEAIKVERPQVGDDLRHFSAPADMQGMSMGFCCANAGKKSLVLDLKQPAAREVFERLVRHCDVLVENFRPGVTSTLGADWPAVREINPKIIYCSITGFGHTGELRERTAYDHIVQATTGLMAVNGDPQSGPRKLGLPAVDTFTAYYAAIAILAAMRRRDATGEGEFIDVSMFDAALTLMSATVATQLHSGSLPKPSGNRAFRVVPTSGTYATRDGHIQIGANHQHQVERLFTALGRQALLGDPRFSNHAARVAHGAELFEIIRAEIATWNAAELEQQLAEQRVPAAMIRSMPQVVAQPHFAARSLMVETSVRGRALSVMRAVPALRGAESSVGEVPDIGQHSDAILRSLDYSEEQIQALRSQQAI